MDCCLVCFTTLDSLHLRWCIFWRYCCCCNWYRFLGLSLYCLSNFSILLFVVNIYLRGSNRNTSNHMKVSISLFLIFNLHIRYFLIFTEFWRSKRSIQLFPRFYLNTFTRWWIIQWRSHCFATGNQLTERKALLIFNYFHRVIHIIA